MMTATPGTTLVSLRDLPVTVRENRCREFFEQVYLPSFTDPAVRETPDVWLSLLGNGASPPTPRLHLIVALGGAAGDEVVGGVVCEYYRRSRAALATYLVVRADHRRRGIARKLLHRGLELLGDEAARAGADPPRLYGESERADHAGESRGRLVALARLGFLASALPYVQPSLASGSPRVHSLMLMIHGDGRTPVLVPAVAVREFLTEFYEAQSCPDPSRDPDLQCMSRWLAAHDPVRFEPVASAMPPV